MIKNEMFKTLGYEDETGLFKWISQREGKGHRHKIGSPAGTQHSKWYIVITYNNKRYYAHRLAWLFFYKKWPDFEIDHANGEVTDNRILNLREASRSENNCNTVLRKDNISGFKGIRWDNHRDKWFCRIRKDNKIYVKRFCDIEDAKTWVSNMREYLHDEFKNHGLRL